MKPDCLLLRVYGEKSEGQWSLINLEFSLAAQADTFEEAKAILESQIREYVNDALTGEDRDHAFVLLHRRAPFKYFVKFWLGKHFPSLLTMFVAGQQGHEQAFEEPMPLRAA